MGFLSWKRISLRKVYLALSSTVTLTFLWKHSLSHKTACIFSYAQDLFWIKRIIALPDQIRTSNSSFVDAGYIFIKQRSTSCLLFLTLKSVSKNCWFRKFTVFSFKIIFQDQKGLPQELFAVKMYALTVDTPPKVYKTRSKTRGNRPQIIKWQVSDLIFMVLISWFGERSYIMCCKIWIMAWLLQGWWFDH